MIKEIQRIRIAAGWSTRDVAKKAGLSDRYVYMVETGSRSPSIAALRKMARAVGMTETEISSHIMHIKIGKEIESLEEKFAETMANIKAILEKQTGM